MKMSDVFNLPVKTISDDNGGLVIQTGSTSHKRDREQKKAMAYAINNHDKLTADNAALVEALENSLNAMRVNGFDEECAAVLIAKSALDKAKGDV